MEELTDEKIVKRIKKIETRALLYSVLSIILCIPGAFGLFYLLLLKWEILTPWPIALLLPIPALFYRWNELRQERKRIECGGFLL